MFFYIAFGAIDALGGLIAVTRLIGALSNSSRAAEVPDILKGIGIDFGALSIFSFLFSQGNNAKNVQLARFTREENLSNLKIRIDEKRTLPLSAFRGIARLVMLAGPSSFIDESFKLSEPFTESLLERGVLIIPCSTGGMSPNCQFQETEGPRKSLPKCAVCCISH